MPCSRAHSSPDASARLLMTAATRAGQRCCAAAATMERMLLPRPEMRMTIDFTPPFYRHRPASDRLSGLAWRIHLAGNWRQAIGLEQVLQLSRRLLGRLDQSGLVMMDCILGFELFFVVTCKQTDRALGD